MSDELTQAPRIDGEFWVFADGRRLPRLRGAEEPVVEEDTPAEDAAPDGTPAPDPEYTPERARGLHSELTKAQQELAEVKNQRDLWGRAQQGDLEAMRELNLPVDFGDDDPADETDESDDPYSTLEQRIAAQEERDQQRAEQEAVERFNADLDKLAAEKDITLSQRERAALYLETLQSGGNPDALNKVFSDLYEERKAYDKRVIENYVKSKKAPHVSSVGTGATEEVLPLDATHQQRVAFMTQRYEAANAE